MGNLEAAAAREVADAHAAWKGRYNSQKRFPLDTPGETWTANMPDHVVEDPDFHVKAPAPVEKVLNDAAKAEAKAEADANPPKKDAAKAEAPAAEAAPSFVQLYRSRNLAQKRAAAKAESESESSASESSGTTSSSSSTDSD